MPQGNTRLIRIRCLACDANIGIDGELNLYDVITCPECEESFEVVKLNPLKLEWIYADDDDDEWFDEDDEDEWLDDDDDDDDWFEDDDDDLDEDDN